MPTAVKPNSPLELSLEFEGVARFTLIDFRRSSDSCGWTNTVLVRSQVVVTGDPAPFDIVPLEPGQQAALVVAANMTSARDPATVKLSGVLLSRGAVKGADSDAGSIPAGGYVGLNLRIDLVGLA